MAAAAFSPGYMKNRCGSSSFMLAPNDWMTLRGERQKRWSMMTYHCLTRRSFAALEHSTRGIPKYYSIQSTKKIHIHRPKPGLGRRWHTSERNSISAVAGRASDTTFTNDNLSLDFWDVLLASLAVAAVSIGLIQSGPYQGQSLLPMDACSNDNDGGALHKSGGRVGSAMKADIEMTLHQPSTFPGTVTTGDAMSNDSRVNYLPVDNHITSTKPYDVRHGIRLRLSLAFQYNSHSIFFDRLFSYRYERLKAEESQWRMNTLWRTGVASLPCLTVMVVVE